MTILFYIILSAMTLIAALFFLIPLLQKSNYKSGIVLLLLFAGGAYLLYGHWGSGQRWLQMVREHDDRIEMTAMTEALKNPEQLTLRMADFMSKHPNNPKGWYLLGRLYLSMEKYPNALAAFRKAHELLPNNYDYNTRYAEAIFFSNNRRLNDFAIHLLQIVLQNTPNNVAANNLLAIDAYQKKNYEIAIAHWEKLLSLVEPESTEAHLLLEMIARAEKERQAQSKALPHE